MPAIVSSVEVSSRAGTSEAEGRRRCPRSSKKRRNVSRISSAVTEDSLGTGDGPPSHHQIAAHEAGRLAGGDAVGVVAELDDEALVGAGADRLDRAGDRPRAVAQPDPIDPRPGAVERRLAKGDPAGGELLPRADDHPVRRGIGGEDVEGVVGADAEPATLANREVMVAAVAAHHAPARGDDLPRPVAEAAVTGEERALALAGEEAQVLA